MEHGESIESITGTCLGHGLVLHSGMLWSKCPPSKATFMKRLLTLILLGVALSGAGCKTYHPALFNRGVGVFGTTVLVVPFSELRHNMWYNESPQGDVVSRTLKFWVTQQHGAGFPDAYVEDRINKEVTDWTGERISSDDWKELVTGYGIDYVVVGDLTKVELKSPRDINLLNPTATARYRVIDTVAGKEFFNNVTTVSTGNLRDDELQIPTLDMGADTARIKHDLLVRLSRKIGKELYGYYEEW